MVGRQRRAGTVIWGELAATDDDGEGGGMSSRVVVGKKREMVGQFRVCAITSQQCWLLIGWSFFPSNHVALWELFTQSYYFIQTYFTPRDEFSGYTSPSYPLGRDLHSVIRMKAFLPRLCPHTELVA